jgi:iron complex transport system substrate-binding protein
MAPNITEILYALGLESRIAGVTRFCNYPASAGSKPSIGGFVNPSIEKIVSLRPDLIIATADGNRKETITRLEQMGLPVYVVKPTTIKGILETILHIGEITCRKEAARSLTEGLSLRIHRVVALTKGLKKTRVFVQVGMDPIITVGHKTVINEIVTLAGGENIAGGQEINYPRYSIEAILSAAPEVIIISTMEWGGNIRQAKAFWQKWPHIPAVKNNRIHYVQADLLHRSSPRLIEGLEQFARIFHREIGKSPRVESCIIQTCSKPGYDIR